MNSLFNRLSVRNRIWALVVLLIGSVVVGGMVSVLTLREVLWREKEQSTRQLVESGISVLAHFHDLQLRGELSEAAAQAAAKDTIRAMRYDAAEYFWITDLGQPYPKMVMHPTIPALDGQLLDAAQFNTATARRGALDGIFTAIGGGDNLFSTAVALVGQGGQGYVTYDWPKPKVGAGVTQQLYPKLSYVKKFAPWGWLLGSGVYIDDVDAVVRQQAQGILLLVLLGGAALLLLSGIAAGSITRPLRLTVLAMRRMDLDGTQPVQRLPIEGPAELAELAGGFNEMLGHIEARDAMLLQHRASLETEVAQRTQELHDTNLQLQQELAKHRVAEQVIQASRIRMRALIDATHESVLLLDPQGLILAINAFGASRFGRLPEEIHGQNFYDLMPQDLAQTRRALVQQVIATGQPMHSQDQRGAVFFHNSLYPVKNAQGAVESVAVFAKDVTEQHRATEMDSIFSDLDAALLTERSNLETVAQMFCDEVLPVFDLVAAWIARVEKDGQLTLVAGAEVPDAGLLARLDARVLRWDGDGRCPVVLALHSGHWELISPQTGACQCCDVHSALGQAQAGIALPLTLRGANWGVLVLYGRDPQQFGAELLTKRLESIAARAGLVFESALQQEWLTLLDTALAGVDNSVFITDAKAKILWVNRAFLQLSGFSSEEVLGHTPHIFSAGVPDSHFNQQFWQTITTGTTWRGDIVNARRDGSHYTVSQTVTPLLNAEGHVSHYISVLEDITQRRSEEERIKHSAQFDLLTDLPNRSLFFDRLGQALALGRRDASSGVLMFLDLDHFKEVNDQFGHAGGDSLLIAVAGRLREQVRESDTVARLGGDEFTVILPKLRDSEDAARLASNIIASLSRPFEIAGQQATIGVSIGIARFPLHGDTVERIVNAADHAMYLSKNAGRNCYTFASVAPEQGATPAPGSAR